MAKKRVPKNEPGQMVRQVVKASERTEARAKARERQVKINLTVKAPTVESSLRKFQAVYIDRPEAAKKKDLIFKKQFSAASTGVGQQNATFSGGLLGKYQVKAFMRYYQGYWDQDRENPETWLDAIRDNGGFDTLQEAWDAFATDPANVKAMVVMQSLAENGGQVPDTEEEWVADLLADADPDYIERLFLSLITAHYGD